MALGTFALIVGGKPKTWRRTFKNILDIETLTGKSIVDLAIARSRITVNELFIVLRAVFPETEVSNKFIQQFIADDWQAAMLAVTDILTKIMGADAERQPNDTSIESKDA